MEIAAIWLIVVAVASPIAGVVAFAIQLRQVKKLRKENEKLELEIEQLKRLAEDAEKRIEVATLDEVKRLGYAREVVFSRVTRREADRLKEDSLLVRAKRLLFQLTIVFAALTLTGYLIFDLYRLGRWLLQ